jgi:hypothetical protein
MALGVNQEGFREVLFRESEESGRGLLRGLARAWTPGRASGHPRCMRGAESGRGGLPARPGWLAPTSMWPAWTAADA